MDDDHGAANPLKSSSARKLPIKRSIINNPHHHQATASPSSALLPPDNGGGGGGDFDDDDDDSDAAADYELVPREADDAHAAAAPFKFQRIWSESDEIRFLQGLLGCHAQGMVFPRDLNIFFDRFSESMAQPFTRSQLSEKLRRLRTKFRVMSVRVDRGNDPSRLAPHDRDILHLCTRLWHPDHAAASPFSSPDASGDRNKRRRRNPPRPISSAVATPVPPSTPQLLSIPPPPLPPSTSAVKHESLSVDLPVGAVLAGKDSATTATRQLPNGVEASNEKKHGNCLVVAKIIVQVFDECIEEARATLAIPDASEDDLAKRWREQRALELDLLSHRWRMVLEKASNG